MKIALYTPQITSRIKYICQDIWPRVGGVVIIPTQNIDFFESVEGIKINYSEKNLSGFQIIPHGLLTESGIQNHAIREFNFKSISKILSDSELEKIDKNLDPFSSIFYIITCYNEYLNKEMDEHGRHIGKHSELYMSGLSHLPVADYIIYNFNRLFFRTYNNIKFANRRELILTVDVDRISKYRGTPLWKVYLKLLYHALISRNKDELTDVQNFIISGKDPAESIEYILTVLKPLHNEIYFFILMDDSGHLDNAIFNTEQINYIRNHLNREKKGIHPGYSGHSDAHIRKKEWEKYEGIFTEKPLFARYHYIKYTLPHDYRNLLNSGIKDDYTMGWHDALGFRAGTAYTYKWFDILNDTCTDLNVHPFMAMDVTLKNYLKLNVSDAKDNLNELYDSLEYSGGQFVTIWHNESLGNYTSWKGWKEMYEGWLKTVLRNHPD